MPGVSDGEIIHTLWTPQTAALVDAGRFEILPQPAPPQTPWPGDGERPAPQPPGVAEPATDPPEAGPATRKRRAT